MALPQDAVIPIVLVSSAYVDEADRELAHRMGANALVVRTPDLRDATAALENGLRGPCGRRCVRGSTSGITCWSIRRRSP